MENIFKDAYFGKPYKTKDGKKALYCGIIDDIHYLVVDCYCNTYAYYSNGELCIANYATNFNIQIIGEWNVENNEVACIANIDNVVKDNKDNDVVDNVSNANNTIGDNVYSISDKDINDYTIYCTVEHVKKAIICGAGIYPTSFDDCGIHQTFDEDRHCYYDIPTVEQMVGWLEDRGILIDIDTEWNKSVLVYVWECKNKSLINNVFHGSRKEAILTAIDAALDYLIENNLIK